MHFEVEHHFSGSSVAVLQAMVDARLYRDLALPDLSQPDVLDAELSAVNGRLQLRYTFVGNLDAIARRLLGGGELRWLQQVEVEFAPPSGRLTFAAEDQPARLHGEAAISVVDAATGSDRRVDGDVVVAVPLVGPLAERRIADGLVGRLELEARAIDDWLIGNR